MIDDSYPFDGGTLNTRAIGGAEKAFALLARALSSRGHVVVAISRCQYQSSIDGVLWLPFDKPRLLRSEVIIAFRKPELLDEFNGFGGRSILWLWGHPQVLNKPANQKILEKYNPAIAFCSKRQRDMWNSWHDFKETIIFPGIADAYINASRQQKMPKPIAIVTTHPLHSLENILHLWRSRIRPKNKISELHVYSASLYNQAFDPKLEKIYYKVAAATGDNVIIKQPSSDTDMAAAYVNARVHFYPVVATDFFCSTLAETQASGMPAIIYNCAAAANTAEHQINNGQTGHVAPDDDAFVNLSIQLLSENSAMYKSLSWNVKVLNPIRNWQNVAIEFESLW